MTYKENKNGHNDINDKTLIQWATTYTMGFKNTFQKI